MPRPRVRRARAFAEVGLEISLKPSAAFGMESLPPISKVSRDPILDIDLVRATYRDALWLVVKLGDVKNCGLLRVASIHDPGKIVLLSCVGISLTNICRGFLHKTQHTITAINNASAGVESGVQER